MDNEKHRVFFFSLALARRFFFSSFLSVLIFTEQLVHSATARLWGRHREREGEGEKKWTKRVAVISESTAKEKKTKKKKEKNTREKNELGIHHSYYFCSD
jgi:hypothetical protein